MPQPSSGSNGTPRRVSVSVNALPLQAITTASSPTPRPSAAFGRAPVATTSGQKINTTPTTPQAAATRKRRVTGCANSHQPLSALPNTISENNTATRPDGM